MSGYSGGCHCGNIRVWFETELVPADLTPRACQCTFCRKHSTRALSDPSGHIHLTIKNKDNVSCYQFGTKTTEYLVCANCGVYVSAYMPYGENAYANVMANVLLAHEDFGPGILIDYGAEDEAEKRERRRRNWAPASLTFEN